MTVTVNLTPELVKTLKDAAESPLPDAPALQRALREIIARMQPPPSSVASEKTVRRVAGLHAGQVWVSGDFDEPLPESFWLGEA